MNGLSIKLEHIAIQCSSKQKASVFFEEILGLKKIDSFELYSELGKKLFNANKKIEVEKFGNDFVLIEVFYSKKINHNQFEHYCLIVDDREKIVEKCRREKLIVKEFSKNNKKWVFVKDYCGNLFELKEKLV